jgi:hypothetical protein
MRRLRRLSMAVVLTFMLGTYALAGIIDCPPGTIETPPAPQASATGTIDTPPSGAQPVAPVTDPVVDIALDLLQSALSLF